MKKYIILLFIAFSFVQCESVLDKKDLGAINGSDVWNDSKLANAYISKIYADNLPAPDAYICNYTDEAPGGTDMLYGQLTVNSVDYWPYNQIRNINIAIEEIDKGSLSDDEKINLMAEAYFFRALRYFDLVKRYGGVPLVLKVQSLSDDLFVSRSKTSECFTQIIKDLDYAIQNLPLTRDAANEGRLTKGAAYAMKGRVLLFAASPQYNPGNDAAKWQSAYTANKTAKEFLETNGYGLYPEYANIWFNEMNEEVVLANRYQEPDRVHNWDAATRPLEESQNAQNGNQPTLEMVESYPMINGLNINAPGSGYDPSLFWKNRDPRFDKTIVINGSLYELSGKAGRIQWTYVGGEKNGSTATGFYCRKAIDVSYTPYYAERSSTDWIDLRYAEVLLNFAECAAETGHPDEAYEQLKAIRNRAGILQGTNNMYGLEEGLAGADLVNAILFERKIEFAFEGKRYWDMRRRKLYESTLNGQKRHGYRISLNVSQDEFNEVKNNFNLDADYSIYFTNEIREMDEKFDINYKPEYYFFAIPISHIEKNPNLQQTNGWDGGTFDPLQ